MSFGFPINTIDTILVGALAVHTVGKFIGAEFHSKKSGSGIQSHDAIRADGQIKIATESQTNGGFCSRVLSAQLEVAEPLLHELGIQLQFFTFVCVIHWLLLLVVRLIGDGDGTFYQAEHSYVMKVAFTMLSGGFLVRFVLILLKPGTVEILKCAILKRLPSVQFQLEPHAGVTDRKSVAVASAPVGTNAEPLRLA